MFNAPRQLVGGGREKEQKEGAFAGHPASLEQGSGWKGESTEAFVD